MKAMLVKWCGKPWLIATYAIGLVLVVLAAFQWSGWETPRRLLCLLAILLPLHVFEENTFPDGFHCMMNLAQNSAQPNVGPMNRLSDMISNFGGEIIFLLLLLWGVNIGSCILVAFFGLGESFVHTLLGIRMYRRLRDKGMKTIYGPGLASAYFTLLPLSIWTIVWLRGQTVTALAVLTGILLIAAIIVLLIRIPILVFGKYQPEYAFSSSGYFRKFE